MDAESVLDAPSADRFADIEKGYNPVHEASSTEMWLHQS